MKFESLKETVRRDDQSAGQGLRLICYTSILLIIDETYTYALISTSTITSISAALDV